MSSLTTVKTAGVLALGLALGYAFNSYSDNRNDNNDFAKDIITDMQSGAQSDVVKYDQIETLCDNFEQQVNAFLDSVGTSRKLFTQTDRQQNSCEVHTDGYRIIGSFSKRNNNPVSEFFYGPIRYDIGWSDVEQERFVNRILSHFDHDDLEKIGDHASVFTSN